MLETSRDNRGLTGKGWVSVAGGETGNEWISKMWYISATEYYSSTKRNEALTHATTEMNWENMVLNERSQAQKATYNRFHCYETSSLDKFMQPGSRLVVTGRWGGAPQVAQWWRICLFRRHRRLGFYPWVKESPWRRKWQPTPVFLPEKPHGQRSLAGYGPWDRRVRHDRA